MKFEKIKGGNNRNFSEGVLFQAIEKFIETSGYPKNLVLRKLDLIEKNIKNDDKELNNMIEKGKNAISEIMTKSNILDDKCKTLLMELKRSFATT